MHTSIGRAKKVITKDINGNDNGYLIELATDGRRTTAYLTVAYPGCFKGFHCHFVREANYTCIKGKAKIILITWAGKEEYILDANEPQRLHIPINIPTAFVNEGEEDAFIVNVPIPAYDPALKDEQLDFTEEEAIEWVKKFRGEPK